MEKSIHAWERVYGAFFIIAKGLLCAYLLAIDPLAWCATNKGVMHNLKEQRQNLFLDVADTSFASSRNNHVSSHSHSHSLALHCLPSWKSFV